MGGLSVWHWIIFAAIIIPPVVIGARSRTFLRAIGWSLALALALLAAMAAIVLSTSANAQLPEPVGGAIFTVLIFVAIAAAAYGFKRLVSGPPAARV